MNKELIDAFFNGECYNAYEYFGAHKVDNGYVFRVYAPGAKEVYLIGDFNYWNEANYQMEKIDNRGIYEIYCENINEDYRLYRYKIKTYKNKFIEKADPYAFFSDLRPNTASKTYDIHNYPFHDEKWLNKRNKCFNAPLNIYEMHLGSWLKKDNNEYYSYEEIADKLVAYILENKYTHVEFMPLMEHPLDMSWGYLCSQYFSVTSRYGNPNQFKYLVDRLHQNNIGVIMDFVPVHFIKDDSALGKFDGTHVYESYFLDKRYSQWDSYLFDYSKVAVMSYMLSCLHFYINIYHIDGIRYDAISNMIFKDGNKEKGLNDANVNWLKKANNLISTLYPSVMLIAEDSSDFLGVTKPTFEGGLGLDYKWDLGWMNDTLKYLAEDPIYRGYDTSLINFSMYYFHTERFLLPLSHDEVVHMKGSIINKIYGSYEEKFQQLRTLYTYMFTHPGKKLNFMCNDIAMFDEWNEDKAITYNLLSYPIHDSFHHYFAKLNELYATEPCLYMDEYNPGSFKWIQCTNNDNVFIYERFYQNEMLVIVLNFSSVHFEHYRFKVDKRDGYFIEILNSDKDIYNGYNFINDYDIQIDNNQEIGIKIQSFSACILKYKHKG